MSHLKLSMVGRKKSETSEKWSSNLVILSACCLILLYEFTKAEQVSNSVLTNSNCLAQKFLMVNWNWIGHLLVMPLTMTMTMTMTMTAPPCQSAKVGGHLLVNAAFHLPHCALQLVVEVSKGSFLIELQFTQRIHLDSKIIQFSWSSPQRLFSCSDLLYQ